MSDQTALVSVIIPIYNVEKYIDQCINSVVEQSLNNIEIVLVDDESTDSCVEKCDYYAKEDNRVHVIHKKNAGLGFARNTGLDVATGEYVVFIDGDDYIEPDHIKKLYEYINQTRSDICIGGHTKVSNKGMLSVQKNPLSGNSYCGDEIKQIVIPRLCGQVKNNDSIEMSACMTIYNRKTIEDNKIRFPSERELISEDLIFNIEVLNKSLKVTMVDTVGYYYRYNGTSLTHRYLPGRFQKQKKLYLTVEDETKKMGIYNLCHLRNINTFTGWARGHIKSEQKEWKQIGIKKSVNNIKEICSDNVLQTALMEIDDSCLSIKSKIVNYLIVKKAARLLWCFSALLSLLKRGE